MEFWANGFWHIASRPKKEGARGESIVVHGCSQGASSSSSAKPLVLAWAGGLTTNHYKVNESSSACSYAGLPREQHHLVKALWWATMSMQAQTTFIIRCIFMPQTAHMTISKRKKILNMRNGNINHLHVSLNKKILKKKKNLTHRTLHDVCQLSHHHSLAFDPTFLLLSTAVIPALDWTQALLRHHTNWSHGKLGLGPLTWTACIF